MRRAVVLPVNDDVYTRLYLYRISFRFMGQHVRSHNFPRGDVRSATWYRRIQKVLVVVVLLIMYNKHV